MLKNDDVVQAVRMKISPAPEELLKRIFCNCKKRCGSMCGCRRLDLYCNATYGTCSGDNCQNCPAMDEEVELENDNNDVSHNE